MICGTRSTLIPNSVAICFWVFPSVCMATMLAERSSTSRFFTGAGVAGRFTRILRSPPHSWISRRFSV